MCRFEIFALSWWVGSVVGQRDREPGFPPWVNFTGIEGNLTEEIVRFIAEYPVDSWMRHGFFRIEYLRKINVHWLSYPPQDMKAHYTLAALYMLIMIVGLSGNFLVIFMYLRFKSLRTPVNTLVMNLAVSDMLMMSKMPIFIYNSIYMGPALGDIACKYYGFLGGLSGTCSICTLSAISLDRYYVVKFPLNRRFTGLRSKICVLLSWTYGITFSAIPLLNIGLGTYVPEGFLTSCSYDYLTDNINAKIFILVFFLAAWLIPFGVIMFAYINIIKVVYDSKKLAKNNMTNRDSTRHMKIEEKRRQELRFAMIVFLVIMLWFAAWTPYAAVSLLGIAGKGNLISPLASMIPALFAKSASCVDPFVYALTHPRFKAELRTICCGRKKKSSGMRFWTSQSRNRSTGCEETSILRRGTKSKKRENNDVELQMIRKPSVLMGPDFRNRSSSLRSMARTWNSRVRRLSLDDENATADSSIYINVKAQL